MGIIFLLRPVLDLILTKKIPQIENFELLIFVTGLGILGLGVVEFFRRLIELREQNYLQLIFQLIAVVLNIILNYFLVKSYGIIGAGIATFLSYFVVVILCNFYLDMNLDYSFLIKLIRIVVASLPISLWLYFHDSNNIYNLAVNIVIGALIYMLSILMLRIVKLKDIKKRLEN
jgi:O-antigen/teichoic acid export membrane protein